MPVTGRDSAMVWLSAVMIEPRWYWYCWEKVRPFPSCVARREGSNACT
jgi:hypothetical protein